MTKVGFVTAPMHDANATRGVGAYTRRLLPELQKQTASFGFEIVENDTSVKIVHYPYFDLFRHTLPIFNKSKIVVTIHDVIPLEFPDQYPPGIHGWFNLQLQKLALSSVDQVITDSYHCIKSVHKYLGVPHAKLKLVYVAADPIFRPLARHQNKFKLPKKFVLYVGDVNYNKNIPNLVTACRLAKLPLVMVGKQAAELEHMDLSHPELRHLRGLSLQGVRRLGYVSDADLVHIYNLATVYCQPSFSEGFGLPVAEALACGTAVACSNTSSLPEIAGDNATYFDPHDVNAMAKALKDAKPSKAQLKFSWAKAAAETLQVYREVLK